MNLFRRQLLITLSLFMIATLHGCATTGEAMITLLETPTVEASANRSAVGSAELRLNNHIIHHMPISADAEWPTKLNQEASKEEQKVIRTALQNDPWYATRHYSDLLQRKMLGGSISPGISPLAYDAYRKVNLIYGPDFNNWPSILQYSSDFDSFLEFVDADKKTPLPIEATQTKLYPNLFSALTDLMPVNFQKDLENSQLEMQIAFEEVADLKAEKASHEQEIKDIKKDQGNEKNDNILSSMAEEIKRLEQQIEVLEVEIEQKEDVADAKQEIHYSVIDSALEKLKSDIQLTPQKVMLAKNIASALNAVKTSSLQAEALYTLSLASLIGKNAFAHFDKELLSLAEATALVPTNKRHLMKERIIRLKDNLIYLFPAIGMGSYYAIKQYNLASKYSAIAEVVVEAGDKQVTDQPQMVSTNSNTE